MKLTKTQQALMQKLWEDIKVFNKYKTFEEFFMNSRFEQGQMPTAARLNDNYNTKEKYVLRNRKGWEDLEKSFYQMRNEHIVYAVCKHETLKVLERLGFIEIIELDNSRCNIDLVKVLKFDIM